MVAPCGSVAQFGKQSGCPAVSVAYQASASVPGEPGLRPEELGRRDGAVLTRTGVVQLWPWSVEYE